MLKTTKTNDIIVEILTIIIEIDLMIVFLRQYKTIQFCVILFFVD